MVRRFFKDSAVYGFATILSKGLTVLMVPIYTAYLSSGQIGMLDLLLGVMAVFAMIIGLDISNALAREYGETTDERIRRTYSSTCLWFTVITFGLALVLILPFAKKLAIWGTGAEEAAPAIRAAAFCMMASGIFLVISQQLRWMMKPREFGLVSVCFTFVSLSVTLLLVGKVRMGEAGVFYGTTAGAVVGTALALGFSKGEFTFLLNISCLRRMVAFCIPIVPSSLSIVISQYISRFVVEHELGRSAVGILGVATRLGGLAGIIMIGFGSALTPLIYEGQNDPKTPLQLARIFRIFVALAAVGLAGLTLFAPELIAILTQSDYSAALPLLTLLAPAFLLSQMYIFAPGPWILRRMWSVAAINIGTACFAVVLNLLLVPKIGLQGAALATLFSAGVNFILSMAVSQSTYPVPHDWVQLAVVVLSGVATMIAASYLPREISLANFFWKSALMSAVIILIIKVSGIEQKWLTSKWLT